MFDLTSIILLFFGLLVISIVAAGAIFVVSQWENAAVIRFGRIRKIVEEPGLHVKLPVIDVVRKIDIRTQTLDLSGQKAITKDNISVGVDAVVFLKVEDVERLITKVEDYRDAVAKYSQATIRTIVGQFNLDTFLESRDEVGNKLKEKVDTLAKDWGIDVTQTEIQDIVLPADMKRALAVQAEAERESRAIKIKAEAEVVAAENLQKAAEIMKKNPIALQLRVLSTINDVSKDESNTIILALPLDTILGMGIQGVGALASIRPKFEKGK